MGQNINQKFHTVNHFLDKIRSTLQNRQGRLNLLTAFFEKDTTAQNLKMGPVKHEYRTAGGDGVLAGKQMQESLYSAKPVPPFPFVKENLLTSEADRDRLNDIWDWTKSINSRNLNVEGPCSICGGIITDSDSLQRCFNCKIPIHESCLGTQNTGWSENEDNLFCEQCFMFNHIGFNASF